MNYHIGDTIVFSANFIDSIFDLNTDHTFKIEAFPFKPYSSLFRFQGDSLFRDGHKANTILVPEENNPVYSFNYTDVVYAETKLL